MKKKINFFIVTLLLAFTVSAQSEYEIDFAGYGDASDIDSIKVINLNRGGTPITIPGDDILFLTSSALGVSDVGNEESGLTIYPNPTDAESKIIITPPSQGEVVISVSDNTGKLVTQISSYIGNIQSFIVKGLGSGPYIISVKGSTYQLSGKLLSTNESSGAPSIEPIGADITSAKKASSVNVKGTTTDFGFLDGDTLRYIAYSGNYTTVATHIPVDDETFFFNFVECVDGDGYHYSIVEIQGQIWMAENLRTTKLTTGEDLAFATTYDGWRENSGEDLGEWIIYNNDSSNLAIYGRLYNWDAVRDGDLCPVGWHVPSDAEWTVFSDILGENAGGQLKARGSENWESPNIGAIDWTGFGALPGGDLWEDFEFLGTKCVMWSSTYAPEEDQYDSWARELNNNDAILSRQSNGMRKGSSIRCLKDE